MTKKQRAGESRHLILACSPPDSALSLVLRWLFKPNQLIASHISHSAALYLSTPTLCTGMHCTEWPPWPGLLSQVWPAVVHDCFTGCLESVWFFKILCFIAKLWYCNWVQLHCISTSQCLISTIHIHPYGQPNQEMRYPLCSSTHQHDC